jgi:hypothetical protein
MMRECIIRSAGAAVGVALRAERSIARIHTTTCHRIHRRHMRYSPVFPGDFPIIAVLTDGSLFAGSFWDLVGLEVNR